MVVCLSVFLLQCLHKGVVWEMVFVLNVKNVTYTERIFIEFLYLSLSYLSVGDSALCRLILKTFHLITKALLYHHFDIGGPDCVTDGWSRTAVPRMSSMVSHLKSVWMRNSDWILGPPVHLINSYLPRGSKKKTQGSLRHQRIKD